VWSFILENRESYLNDKYDPEVNKFISLFFLNLLEKSVNPKKSLVEIPTNF